MKQKYFILFLLTFLFLYISPLSSLVGKNDYFLYNVMQNSKYNPPTDYSIKTTNFKTNSICSEGNFYKIKGSFFKECNSSSSADILSNSPRDVGNSALGHGDEGTVIVNIPASESSNDWEGNRFMRGGGAQSHQNSNSNSNNQNSNSNSNNQNSNSNSNNNQQITNNSQQITNNNQQITNNSQLISQQTTTQISTNITTFALPLFSTNTADLLNLTSFSAPASPVNGKLFNFQTLRLLSAPIDFPDIQNFSVAVPAPEPATWLLFGAVLCLLAIFNYTRHKKQKAES